jgi:hypothetical protein
MLLCKAHTTIKNNNIPNIDGEISSTNFNSKQYKDTKGTYCGKKVMKFHSIIPATIAQKRIHHAYPQFCPLEG